MTAEFPYTKLPGVRRGLIRKAALWEGSDHLFSVSGTRFSEQYRRFYYRDIQALVMQRCARPGSIGVWLLTALFCGLFALLFTVRKVSGGPRFAFGSVSAVLFLYLVYRLIVSLKYSCRCYVQTAVAWEELPSLYRIWNTRKALERVRAKIVEAQGALAENPQTLAAAAMEQGTAELSSFRVAPAIAADGGADSIEENRAAVTGMNLTLLGCVALLAIAAFLFWYMDASAAYTGRLGILTVNGLLTLITGAAFLLALLRVYKMRALHSLRSFLFAALSLTGLHVYFSSLLLNIYPQQDVIGAALRSPAFRHWFSLIDGSSALLFGLSGVALIVFNRESYSKGAVSNA